MKIWEHFNELTHTNETLKQQALGIFAEKLLEAAGVRTGLPKSLDCERLYDSIVDFLEKEVETK